MSRTPPQRYRIHRVSRYRDGSFHGEDAPVVSEVPVTVSLNGREIITLLASDDALEYLAVGFLKSEGFFERREELHAVRLDRAKGLIEIRAATPDPLVEKLFERRTVTSGCGKGTTFYHALDALRVTPAPPGPRVAAEELRALMRRLHEHSDLYRIAGGVHNAALCTPEEIVLFRDDIGRHNAIDKIHGECFLEGIPVADKILVSTGRISSEILIKAGKIGLALMVSRSSPTGLALDLAERIGITVVGKVRGGGLTVYTRPERVSG